jgi:ATP-dependent DNA ligase
MCARRWFTGRRAPHCQFDASVFRSDSTLRGRHLDKPHVPYCRLHRALPAIPRRQAPVRLNWIHEIKHDGFRLRARRDPVGIRLITRRGNDWTRRYPLVVEAVNHLAVRSCLIDGEVVCCDERGLATFQLLRHRRNEPQAFLYAFDLLELNGFEPFVPPPQYQSVVLCALIS